jgi:hypothetical protein
MYLKLIWHDSIAGWIHVPQDMPMVQLRALVNTVMNHWVPLKAINFLTR